MDAAEPHVYGNLTTTPTLVKTGPTELTVAIAYNPSNAAAYIQCFDAAAGNLVTLGNTSPAAVIGMPTVGVNPPVTDALRFTNGLVIAATTTPTGNVAPSAGVEVTLGVR